MHLKDRCHNVQVKKKNRYISDEKDGYLQHKTGKPFFFPFQLLWTNLMTALDVWVFLFLPASFANGLTLLLYSARCGTSTHSLMHLCVFSVLTCTQRSDY